MINDKISNIKKEGKDINKLFNRQDQFKLRK